MKTKTPNEAEERLREISDGGRALAGFNLKDVVALRVVLDECDRLRAEVDRLREEARRYYKADGSWSLLPTAEEVVERRKAAARLLANLYPKE